jgi:hypothetical protein
MFFTEYGLNGRLEKLWRQNGMTSTYPEDHSLSENSREPYSRARLVKQGTD